MKCRITAFIILLSCSQARASIFGEESVILGQMLANQLRELENMAESIGISRDERDLLVQINEGVNQTTQQIEAIESIAARIEGNDPFAVRSLADLNRSMDDMKALSGDIQELLLVKMMLCDEAVEEASLQSDTSYKMGQEMVDLGSALSKESKTASPGRSQQISASASSAQMLAMGVELQTLSQISQLLAMSLDLQKAQMEKDLRESRVRNAYVKQTLTQDRTSLLKTLKSQPVARTRGRRGGKR